MKGYVVVVNDARRLKFMFIFLVMPVFLQDGEI